MRMKWEAETRFVAVLGMATLVGVGLLTAGSLDSGSFAYWYLVTNIVLAWAPFALALWLKQALLRKRWSSWQALALSVAWLVFLPNSFYMVSDFIHLNEVGDGQILLLAVTMTLFVFVALILGIASVYLIHRELLKRVSYRVAGELVGGLLLTCSVAIYIGRDLRWNTWDVLINPWGLLFDLSERLLHPAGYGQVAGIVVPFFVLLCSLYAIAWYGLAAVRLKRPV